MNTFTRCVALVCLAALTGVDTSRAFAAMPGSSMAAHDRSASVSSATHLELEVVMGRVIERNPTLGAARAAWTEATARARQAGALEDPMVDAMVAPRSIGAANVDAGYRIGLTQSLPLFGQRGLRRRMGEAEAQVAAWDLRTLQLDLLRETRLVYVDYWRIGRAIALNRELLSILPELRRVSLARYSAGLVGQQDPLQVDVELAMLDHESVILERRRRIAVAMLNVLMHEPAEGSLPPPPDTLALPDTTLLHSELASRARALRPELRAAEARVEASRAGVALSGRSRFPETSFGIAYDRFWSEPELRTTVVLTMSLPINLGRRSAFRAEAQARLEASEKQSEAAQDSVEFQVAAAAARLHESAHDVQIARERLVPLAERALRASQASYEANKTDFITVLSSLRNFLRARLEADDSLAMLHEARADLARALGEIPNALEKEKLP